MKDDRNMKWTMRIDKSIKKQSGNIGDGDGEPNMVVSQKRKGVKDRAAPPPIGRCPGLATVGW
jgi:hypothetical protein